MNYCHTNVVHHSFDLFKLYLHNNSKLFFFKSKTVKYFKKYAIIAQEPKGEKPELFPPVLEYIIVSYIKFRVKINDSANQDRWEYKMAAVCKYYFDHEIGVISYVFDFIPPTTRIRTDTKITNLPCLWCTACCADKNQKFRFKTTLELFCTFLF